MARLPFMVGLNLLNLLWLVYHNGLAANGSYNAPLEILPQ